MQNTSRRMQADITMHIKYTIIDFSFQSKKSKATGAEIMANLIAWGEGVAATCCCGHCLAASSLLSFFFVLIEKFTLLGGIDTEGTEARFEGATIYRCCEPGSG